MVIYYNPVSYSAPTSFSTRFVLNEDAALSQKMLLFPNGDKLFDGTSNAVLTGFNTTPESGLPSGVTLVADPGATAVFDDSAVGSSVGITFAGYSLAGPNAGQYALAQSCCTVGSRTRGTITAAATPTPTPVPTPPPGPAPVPTPAPTVLLPAVLLPAVQQPITSLAPAIAILPVSPGLAIAAGGVRMPSTQLASLQAPQSLADDRSVSRAGSDKQGSAFLPKAPVVPVYRPKQARH